MRVTSQFQSAQTIRDLQRSQFQLSKFRNEVSSGLRITRPSDDPTASAVVRRNRAEIGRLETDLGTINEAGNVHQNQVTALVSVRETLTRASQLAIELNDGSKESPFSQTTAVEAEALLEQIINLTNKRLADGRSIFAGTASDRQPFAFEGTDAGKTSRVTYQGSNEESEVIIGRSQTVSTFISGQETFQARDRQTTEYFGSTGAAAGTGTDSATGTGRLTVINQTTTYTAASGLAASAVAGDASDTIGVGSHSVVIDTATTTIQINGGVSVNYSLAADPSDVTVSSPSGESIRIDTTGGLVNGTFQFFRGELSLNGEASVAISADNQSLTEADGRVTYVDTTGINAEGTDIIHYAGSYDIFESVIALRDIARNDGGISARDRGEFLSKLLGEFARMRDSVLESVGTQSARAENLRTTTTRIEDVQLGLLEDTSELEDADIPESILNLQTQENLLQASLAVAARINQLSLVDFIA